MGNKYRKLAEGGTAAPATSATKSTLATPEEQMAAQDKAAESTAGPLGAIAAAAQTGVEMLPGGKYLEAKMLGALGVPEQFTAGKQAQLEAEHPVASPIGTLLGAAATLPAAAAGAGFKALSGVQKIAATGAAAGMMTPVYKLGDIANQAQLTGDPLHMEQISHIFDFKDILKASLLGTVMGGVGVGMEAAASAKTGKVLEAASESQAGKLFRKAAERLGMSEDALGAKVMDEGLLAKAGEIQYRKQRAWSRVLDSAAQAEVTPEFQERLGTKLIEMYKGTEHLEALENARKFMRSQTRRLLSDKVDGKAVEEVAQSLNNEGSRAFEAGRTQKGQMLKDGSQLIRDEFASHMQQTDPEAAARYRTGVQDYRVYSELTQEAIRGAAKQATRGDIEGAIGKVGVAHVVGGAIGGPAGALASDVVAGSMGLGKLGVKNYAILLGKMSKMSPSEQFEAKATATLDRLLAPSAALSSKVVADDVTADYEQISKALKNSIGDPAGMAKRLRAQVSFLPPHIADAFVANSMDKLQSVTMDLPPENGPATAFGIVSGVSDRQKREFFRKASSKFDVFSAIESGRADLILEAEKFNPEAMHNLKGRLVKELSERENVDYLTKRRLQGMLGVAGTPLQDPALGGQLQQVIQTKKQADSAVGQMGSARQMNANLKRDSGTLTRAQGILNSKE